MKRAFYISLLKQTFSQYSADKVPRLSAAVAFYSMLSIGPLMLIFLSAAQIFYGADAARGRLLHQIEGLIGHDGALAIQDILKAANHEDNSVLASIIGLATLLVGASGVFGELQDAFNTIWHVKPRQAQGFMLMLRRRFFSFAMVFSTGFLLLISLVLSAALSALNEMNADLFPGSATVMAVMNGGISFAVVTALFAGLFKFVPDAHIAWRDVWAGALLTAALFTLGKFAIGLYLGHSAISSAYGAAGSLVVVLVWVYYTAQILYFGAEFTHLYQEKRKMVARG